MTTKGHLRACGFFESLAASALARVHALESGPVSLASRSHVSAQM